jgi:hypothetical protein
MNETVAVVALVIASLSLMINAVCIVVLRGVKINMDTVQMMLRRTVEFEDLTTQMFAKQEEAMKGICVRRKK